MTPKELRISILWAAIQGKLVEQRPDEGTGSELFGQIQDEQQALIKAGAKKRGKPIDRITEEEHLFEIPSSWCWVRLGAIANTMFAGGDKPKDFTETPDANRTVPVIANGVTNDGILGYTSTPTAKANTITVAGRGTIGFSLFRNYEYCPIVRLIVIEQSSLTNPQYLQYVIEALPEKSLGTSIPQLTVPMLYPKVIPLPPLGEQNRIVAKLREILPLVDRYETAWNKLEEFNKRFPGDMQKSILQLAIQGKLVEQRPEEGTGEELFQQIQAEYEQEEIKPKRRGKKANAVVATEQEPPFDIPETWKWVKLGQLGYTNIGLTYSPKDVCNDGVVVLRSSNIQNGKMDYEDIVRVSCSIPDNKKCNVGDILICARNGSKRLVGKAALIDQEGMSFGAFMAIFRSVCNPYILHVINSAYFRNTLLGDTGTTTINQITQDMLKNMMIPLPPLAEQKRIVAKLEEILPLCARLK